MSGIKLLLRFAIMRSPILSGGREHSAHKPIVIAVAGLSAYANITTTAAGGDFAVSAVSQVKHDINACA
jgi:hypothetical protein